MNEYPFRPRENHEKLFGDEVSYLSVIKTPMYFANKNDT